MKDIFTGIYNKVIGFFRQTEQEANAKDIACNRLRVVLMQDRTNLTPELMERMRKELVELLSKYVEMDKEALELNLEQDGDQMALMLSIPVIRAKDEEEIKEALEQQDSSAEETEETEETETSDTESEDKQEDEDKDIKCEDYDEECAECNECEFSDDVECEIKKKKRHPDLHLPSWQVEVFRKFALLKFNLYEKLWCIGVSFLCHVCHSHDLFHSGAGESSEGQKKMQVRTSGNHSCHSRGRSERPASYTV